MKITFFFLYKINHSFELKSARPTKHIIIFYKRVAEWDSGKKQTGLGFVFAWVRVGLCIWVSVPREVCYNKNPQQHTRWRKQMSTFRIFFVERETSMCSFSTSAGECLHAYTSVNSCSMWGFSSRFCYAHIPVYVCHSKIVYSGGRAKLKKIKNLKQTIKAQSKNLPVVCALG